MSQNIATCCVDAGSLQFKGCGVFWYGRCKNDLQPIHCFSNVTLGSNPTSATRTSGSCGKGIDIKKNAANISFRLDENGDPAEFFKLMQGTDGVELNTYDGVTAVTFTEDLPAITSGAEDVALPLSQNDANGTVANVASVTITQGDVTTDITANVGTDWSVTVDPQTDATVAGYGVSYITILSGGGVTLTEGECTFITVTYEVTPPVTSELRMAGTVNVLGGYGELRLYDCDDANKYHFFRMPNLRLTSDLSFSGLLPGDNSAEIPSTEISMEQFSGSEIIYGRVGF